MGFFSRWCFRRNIVRVWDLSGLKDMFLRVGLVCDFTQICSERRSCCLPVWGMKDAPAEGGVISKEIKRIFHRVGDHWLKPEKEQGPERYLEELLPGQEEGMKELHLGPHGDCDRRVSLRAMSGDGLGYHRKRVWWAGQGARLCQKHMICPGIHLGFPVWHWGLPSIVGRAEAAYPG